MPPPAQPRQSARCANVGGYSFAARPDKSAVEQPVYWAPQVDPGIVNLVEVPPDLRAGEGSPFDVPLAGGRHDEMGRHMRSPPGGQLALLGETQPGKPLAAIIPLDEMAHDRLHAIERFIRAIHRQYLPDARLTAAQRRRLGNMLRCLDGRDQQASHFEVATALFGRRLVSVADWHDSAFRYQTHRLLRDGLKMVERGYRQLLRARRRHF
ncbi:MAG: DUF2285 domain-containing protein [Mesorhizobium sp.]|nr:MAG: DUF2285 domain-containing protein [Mesorhizobium sp.]